MDHSSSQVVGIVGDIGHDIFTLYDAQADDRRRLKSATDIHVPAGALYTEEMLRLLLLDHSEDKSKRIVRPLFDIQSGGVATIQTFSKKLRTLREYGGEFKYYGGDRGAFRLEHPMQIHIKTDSQGYETDHFDTDPQIWDDERFAEQGSPHRLVIVDAGEFGRVNHKNQGKLHKTIKDVAALGEKCCPTIFVDLFGKDFPNQSFPNSDQSMTVWDMLSESGVSDRVCVVVSASMLRGSHGVISKRLSWEQTVEDISSELEQCPILRYLSQFGHLVIRFGMAGALHIRRKDGKRDADLIFLPEAKDGIVRDPPEDGDLMAKNSFLIATIIREVRGIDPGDSTTYSGAITEAIKKSLLGLCLLFKQGFDYTLLAHAMGSSGGSRNNIGKELIRKLVFGALSVELEDSTRNCSKLDASPQSIPIQELPACVKVNQKVMAGNRLPTLVEKAKWKILHSGSGLRGDTGDGSIMPIGLAMSIVKYGRQAVLNRFIDCDDTTPGSLVPEICRELTMPPCELDADDFPDGVVGKQRPYVMPKMPEGGKDYGRYMSPEALNEPYLRVVAPLMQVDKFVTVDRIEIESFRTIRNLIKTYVDREMSGSGLGKPISIAVFGPPGGGKSFAVKCIANNLNNIYKNDIHRKKIRVMGYNVAQFRTIDDLEIALTGVASANNEGDIPLVFFDEFDTPIGTKKLGWLQYFLAPMEDGQFRGAAQTITIGRAIFVFAGGISKSYLDFVPIDPSLPRIISKDTQKRVGHAKRKWKKFEECKGPDFVSRLRGHIDVLPLDAGGGDQLPLIRRALVIRGIIEEMGLLEVGPQRGVASVDDDILYALLTMSEYRHGPRSIRAVLQMCTTSRGQILNASLPARRQLDMHVNSDEFFIRMHRSRVRRQIRDHGLGLMGGTGPKVPPNDRKSTYDGIDGGNRGDKPKDADQDSDDQDSGANA